MENNKQNVSCTLTKVFILYDLGLKQKSHSSSCLYLLNDDDRLCVWIYIFTCLQADKFQNNHWEFRPGQSKELDFAADSNTQGSSTHVGWRMTMSREMSVFSAK